MAIRAQEAKVLKAVIGGIAVDVIQLESDRLAKPLGNYGAPRRAAPILQNAFYDQPLP